MLVVASLGIFLLGAMGLAIDGAQLYAHREMAQAAADGAAQAGIFSIYAGTVTPDGVTHTCVAADLSTSTKTKWLAPCAYANVNGFMTPDDTVVVSYPPSPYNGVTATSNAAKYPFPFEQVSITRVVHTTLMQFLGTSTSSITVVGGAGIVQKQSPVPILVLDRTLGHASFSMNGNPTIQICGGPQRSIQINSGDPAAISISGTPTVNLSRAGPADSGTCTTGTGGDFAVFGSTPPFPSWLTPVGITEHYRQPAAPLNDPLASVAPPAMPGAAPAPVNTGLGTSAGSLDCPASAGVKGCTIYKPGLYSGGIEVKNTTGIFHPGIYYMDGSDGFHTAANGDVIMCSTTCVADTSGCCSNNGMLVYLSRNAGAVNVSANSVSSLLGSSNASSYKGILFFVARDATDHNPSLGGGGAITLVGTEYMPTQTLSLSGGSGSSTLLKGEMIMNDLSLGGNSGITMQLDAGFTLLVEQVALVK